MYYKGNKCSIKANHMTLCNHNNLRYLVAQFHAFKLNYCKATKTSVYCSRKYVNKFGKFLVEVPLAFGGSQIG